MTTCFDWAIRATMWQEYLSNQRKHKLSTRYESLGLRLLQEPVAEGEPSPLSKAKAMYSGCMDGVAREDAGVAALTDLFGKHGGWPIAVDG